MTTNEPPGRLQTIESKILNNALEIIHHTGLLKNEVVKLNTDDVFQNGCILPQIQSVSGAYPIDIKKAPITLSGKAQKLIDDHIKYLNAKGFPIVPGSPLFPCAITNERYVQSKLWHSLSKFCIYNSYERHREARYGDRKIFRP